MSDELNLDRMKQLEAKATKGPWALSVSCTWIMADHLHVATIPRAADGDWSENNGLFIAASRTFIPAAIAEIEKLRAVAVAAKEYRDCPPGRGIEKNAKGIALDTAIAAWEKKS